MILQKLASAIRRQDWFQVIIEILIVIVGIFLGLQVTEWNDQRIDRKQEVVYLERLLVETKNSLATNEAAIDIAFRQWQDAHFIRESVESCSLARAEQDRFARGLWFTGKIQAIELSMTVVEELKSTGKYQILRSVKLREALTDLESTYNHIRQINQSMSNTINFHINTVDTFYDFKNTQPDPNFPFMEILWADIELDFDKLCNSNKFKNSYSHLLRSTNGYVGISRRVLDKQREVIKIIEQGI